MSVSDRDVATSTSRDAVVVVPGVMGSELVETATGRTLWGMRSVHWYLQAWTSGRSLADLRLTDDELDGRCNRVQATQLLRFPAYAPVLRGMEPYAKLLEAVKNTTLHPDAVLEFAFDWRLPVTHNSRLLAEATYRHLESWRKHPVQLTARRADPYDEEAKVVVVAHSMGGLLAWHLGAVTGTRDVVRATVTLGTPFYGAVKAATLLSSGRTGPLPLPRAKLRRLAAALPGIYDLLPVYRCVDTGTSARALTPSDVAGLGADRDLAERAMAARRALARHSPPGLVQVVGAHQPTPQSLTLADGVATGHSYICRATAGDGIERVDRAGDGTVPRDSAQLPSMAAMPLAQSHGAIARADEALIVVGDVMTDRRTGPWLGTGEIGLELPDVAVAGTTFDMTVTGVEHPRDALCRVFDLATGRQVSMPPFVTSDDEITTSVTMDKPGLYRVVVTGGGASSVSQLFLVCHPSAAGREGDHDII